MGAGSEGPQPDVGVARDMLRVGAAAVQEDPMPQPLTHLTNPALDAPNKPHALGEVLFFRDGLRATHLIMPAGTQLPEHALPDDAVVVVIRGKGVIYVQQEPRHVEGGTVVDLVPHEEYSIEAIEELEMITVQAALASHAPPADDFL